MKSLFISLLLFTSVAVFASPVTHTPELISAIENAAEGDTIEIAPGTYHLDAPLEPKTGITIRGAGVDKTIITHTTAWKPSVKTLPDPEVRMKGLDSNAYLIRIQDKAKNVTLSDLTLRGPNLHGAIFSFGSDNLHLHDLRIVDFLWSGLRTYAMKNSKVHDCKFIDAGGKWKRGGIPGTDGGISGARSLRSGQMIVSSPITVSFAPKTVKRRPTSVSRTRGKTYPHSPQHHRCQLLYRVPV